MKRQIPLFLFDLTRKHGLGEVDFVQCTDQDNAFTAICEYVEGDIEEQGDDYRTCKGSNSISCRMRIIRQTGINPSIGQTRTLLKKAMETYCKHTQKEIDIYNPSLSDCIEYLEALISGNRHHINTAKDYTERQTTLMSLKMLEHIKGLLEEENIKKL